MPIAILKLLAALHFRMESAFGAFYVQCGPFGALPRASCKDHFDVRSPGRASYVPQDQQGRLAFRLVSRAPSSRSRAAALPSGAARRPETARIVPRSCGPCGIGASLGPREASSAPPTKRPDQPGQAGNHGRNTQQQRFVEDDHHRLLSSGVASSSSFVPTMQGSACVRPRTWANRSRNGAVAYRCASLILAARKIVPVGSFRKRCRSQRLGRHRDMVR
jgi:hypothetical protein